MPTAVFPLTPHRNGFAATVQASVNTTEILINEGAQIHNEDCRGEKAVMEFILSTVIFCSLILKSSSITTVSGNSSLIAWAGKILFLNCVFSANVRTMHDSLGLNRAD